MSGRYRNHPCPCGSGVKFKRCCLDKPLTPTTGGNEITLEIETEEGMFLRSIPQASTLREGLERGKAAEGATEEAAATWGLPDFIFGPETIHKGGASREVGDRLIIPGSVALVVQVKSREAPTEDGDKERRWIRRHAAKALRQAEGTARYMRGKVTAMANARGRQVSIDGDALSWVSVVVIDHPEPPGGVTVPLDSCKQPAVVLFRRDWEFLFDQLKSAYAVCDYVKRVAGEELPLGTEPVRYYELAQADHVAQPEPPDPRLVTPTSHYYSQPPLPLAPAGFETSAEQSLYRALIEDIALASLEDGFEDRRAHVLSALDQLPVGERDQIGDFLIQGLESVLRAGRGETIWHGRTLRGLPNEVHLGFMVSTRISQIHRKAFDGWLRLRHHDYRERIGIDNLISVGVLLTPKPTRQWDTTMHAIRGDIGLTDEERSSLREVWPDRGFTEAAHNPLSTRIPPDWGGRRAA